MKCNRFQVVLAIAAVAAATLALTTSSADAVVLLQTDFTGTTNDGTTLGNITYTTSSGLSGPGSLSGASQTPAHTIHNTANATSHYAPNVQVNNSTWNVDIPLTVTGADVQVEDVLLDRQHFNVAGNFNTAGSKTYPIIATLTGSTSGQVGQVTLDPDPWPTPAATETFTFGAPVTLTSSEAWTLNVQVNDGGPTHFGIYVGFGGFGVQGTTGGTVQAGLVNGDFSDNTLRNAGGGAARMFWSDIDQGWVAKEGGNNWEISGGTLNQLARSGSETRSAQFFTNDMTGTGWELQLTLGGPGNITSDNVLVWGGVDDGNNAPDTQLMGLGSDGPPESGTGVWTELVGLEDVPTGPVVAPVAEDLGQFDVIGVMINSPRGGGQPSSGLTVDDVRFFNPSAAVIPEPSTFALAALGLLGLAWFGRRRRR